MDLTVKIVQRIEVLPELLIEIRQMGWPFFRGCWYSRPSQLSVDDLSRLCLFHVPDSWRYTLI